MASPGAKDQHARFGTRQHLPHTRNRVRAPVAIDIEREQMVGQVVTMRHAAEHGAYPLGRLPLAARALWRRAVHARLMPGRPGWRPAPDHRRCRTPLALL